MGILRMLFAITVLINHSYPIFGYELIGPDIAVRSFFVISGFYMALILNEKYIKKNYSYILFLTNRWLRIFPVYLFLLLLVFLFSLYWLKTGQERVLTPYLLSFKHLSKIDSISLAIDGIIRNITLIVTSHYVSNADNERFLLINQGWTLQQELLFYFIAPLLALRKFLILITVIIIFLAVRHVFIDPHHVLGNNSILYRFIENFIYFVMGIIAYRMYLIVIKTSPSKKILLLIWSIFLIFTLIYKQLPSLYHAPWQKFGDFVYYAVLTLAIPFLFYFTKNIKTDRFIGNLSYPLYICHFVILEILVNFFNMDRHSSFWTITGIIFSIGVSILITKIEKPIERFRQYRVRYKSKKLIF